MCLQHSHLQTAATIVMKVHPEQAMLRHFQPTVRQPNQEIVKAQLHLSYCRCERQEQWQEAHSIITFQVHH